MNIQSTQFLRIFSIYINKPDDLSIFNRYVPLHLVM